ncbi:MAG: DUF3455 domain-containing protein [Steroidobacteraceae bacterium]
MPSKIIFIVALAMASSVTAVAAEITPPAVPDILTVEQGSKAFAIGHAVGTQNYVCLPDGAVAKWVLYSPQATVFDGEGEQIMTHFLSPNPAESSAARPTWQHSSTTSAVWAVKEQESDDPAYVAPGAIKWFLLRVVGAQSGTYSRDPLPKAKFIHRVNTVGGIAPATGCVAAGDIGKTKLVPYTADYVFYR